MSQDLVKQTQQQQVSVYSNAQSFEHAQRIAKMLCTSSLVPTEYQNNMSNTLVALEMANRVGASPLMVMQNLNVINGRPSWSSPFIIASINSCGRFSPLKFQFEDRGDKTMQYEYWTGSKAQNNRRKETGTVKVRDLACRAYTTDGSGEILEGPWVSIEMAVNEGWYTKSDSKWKTMPEVMLRYRSAAFFGRLYCPEIMLGMHTSEEVMDISSPADTATVKVDTLNGAIRQAAVASEPVQEAVVLGEQPAAEETKPPKSRRRAPVEEIQPDATEQDQTANDDDLV